MNKILVTALAALALLAATATANASQTTLVTLSVANPLVGTWLRTNSCAVLVRTLIQARLKDLVPDVLVGGGYFGQKGRISAAHPCEGARNVKHSHFFTAAGGFGSYDETGQQDDDGDYKIIARNTLAFPSHAREFGYKITVRYAVRGGRLSTSVVVPHPCTGKCRWATAWAISAFYPLPFRRTT